MEYNVGDVVRCTWGTKPVEYEAKIIHVNSASREYFVHYQGWNKRYDEWISEKSIIGASRKKQSTPLRYDTPKVSHSRREKKLKKPIDWSPTSSASAALASEKSAVEREQNKHHVPITKRRHSPAVSKAIKTLPALPVVATVDDMAEESVTSDEEDGGDDALPRSYIDVLAKEKKRAEKESQRKASPKTTTTTHRSAKNTSKLVDHEEDGGLVLDVPRQELDDLENRSESAPSPDVSSTSVECHGFSSIGGDHNYSSLRFHYNETPPPSGAEKEAGNGHVTSSTRRVHILPIRKPLDIEYTLPYSPSTFKFAKPSSIVPTRRQRVDIPSRRRVDVPPNLGAPFTYCDEYHTSLPVPMECGTKGSCAEQAIAVSNLLNVDISDSVTTSSSSSESEGSLSVQPQIVAKQAMSPFTVST